MKFRLNYYIQYSAIVLLILLSHSNEEHFRKSTMESYFYIDVILFSIFMCISIDFFYQKWLNSKSQILNEIKLILLVTIFVSILLILIKCIEFYYANSDLQLQYAGYFDFLDKTGAWNSFFQEQVSDNSFSFLGYHYFYFLDKRKEKSKLIEKKQLVIEELKKYNKDAYLLSLQNQVNPHFLFNSLNSITGLIYQAPEKASKMIKYLQAFFNLMYKDRKEFITTIENEVKLIDNYLKIEAIRFENRLALKFNIDKSLLKKNIPNLILQPIVENAIKHGISPYQEKGFISIHAVQLKNKIQIEIHDSGKTLDKKKTGYGLKNIKLRLKSFYHDKASFTIENSKSGTIARLVIPD